MWEEQISGLSPQFPPTRIRIESGEAHSRTATGAADQNDFAVSLYQYRSCASFKEISGDDGLAETDLRFDACEV